MNLTHTLSNLEKQQLAGKFVAEAFSNDASSTIKNTAETFLITTHVFTTFGFSGLHNLMSSIICLYTGGASCVLYLCNTCQGLESNHVPIASGSNLLW